MYGFYRNTYDILLDLGKYLSKNNNLWRGNSRWKSQH
jgi:hypothetical protein